MSIKDKTIILVLSSTMDDNGNIDLNQRIEYAGVKVPFTTKAMARLAAFGRDIPRNEAQCELALDFLQNTKMDDHIVKIIPATNAWKNGDKWDSAICLEGWNKITKDGNVIKPNIMFNLSKIAPDVFGNKADGGSYYCHIANFDMGVFNNTFDKTGVQILREWQAIAQRIEVPHVKGKYGDYVFKTKGIKYQPDWQEDERGLPYASLRFGANSAMYIVLKWKVNSTTGKAGYGRVPVELFNLDGTPKTKQVEDKLTGTVKTVQRKEPGFGMIGDAKFIPFSWDSKTCRETFSNYYSFRKEWKWEGDDTNL